MIRRSAGGTLEPDEQVARMERVVRERVRSGRSTGIAAGLLLPGGRTETVACGDAGHGRALDERSVFEIGSITKLFTGTLLAEMAQRGEVNLSDPVAKLLPAHLTLPSRNGRQILLRDLATHTSGLPSSPDNLTPADELLGYADYTVDALYDFLGRFTLTRHPGAKYEYSNLGVGLLGHALALRAQTGYEELVRDRILRPLGMTHTAIAAPAGMARHLVCGHDGTGSVVEHCEMPTLAGAGALRSSIGDLLRFAEAHLSAGHGLSRPALAATHTPRKHVGPLMRIGLTWHIIGYRAKRILGHSGATAGFTGFIALHPARRTASVVLSNCSFEGVDDIGLHLIEPRLRLSPPPKPHTAITLPAAVLERYVGIYDMAGRRVEVTQADGGLSARMADARTYRLHPETDTRFFVREVNAEVSFKVARDRTTITGVVRQPGQKHALKKLR